jgi:imidazolonepropionase
VAKKTPADLLITECGELLTMGSARNGPRTGADLAQLDIVNNASIAVRDGRIVWLGQHPEDDIELCPGGVELSAAGAVVSPGLVDAHTHPVFAATREMEFEMRALGKSYSQIAAAGGGIIVSVASLRKAGHDELLALARPRLDRMLRHGTTTIEAKSGYGLNVEDEIKTLEVIRILNETHPLDLVPTVLAGHEFPPEYRDDRDGYVRLITEEILPAVARRNLAEFSDVFFEEGVFNREQTIAVQKKAKALGLGLKFHADEITDQGGAALAAQMNAISADHLECISDNGIKQMADAGVFAVLLPGTAYYLDMARRPPARKMIQSGVPVALATDCNPGSCMTESMQMVLNLACVMYKMTPAEAFVAATANAAYSINRGREIGILGVGRRADLVIWDAENYRQVPYHFGVNLARVVIKKGKVVS